MPFINGGGGGGLPSGLTFTDAGGNPLLTLVSGPNGTAEITSSGLGAQVQITAADGDASHVGGEIVINSGGSAGFDAGNVIVSAGDDHGGGSGGDVIIESGSSTGDDSWNGGDINIRANPGALAGHQGGHINVVAGEGTTSGNVIVQGGAASGNVQVYSGDGNQYVQLDNGGLQIGATKLGFFQGAAVVQPVVPLTLPTTQNVIAALVALGLVAQHD